MLYVNCISIKLEKIAKGLMYKYVKIFQKSIRYKHESVNRKLGRQYKQAINKEKNANEKMFNLARNQENVK